MPVGTFLKHNAVFLFFYAITAIALWMFKRWISVMFSLVVLSLFLISFTHVWVFVKRNAMRLTFYLLSAIALWVLNPWICVVFSFTMAAWAKAEYTFQSIEYTKEANRNQPHLGEEEVNDIISSAVAAAPRRRPTSSSDARRPPVQPLGPI